MRLVPAFLRPAYDALYQRASRGFDRILDGVEKREIHDDSDYLADAEWAMAEQKLRGSRIAVLLTCLAVLVLIGFDYPVGTYTIGSLVIIVPLAIFGRNQARVREAT